MKKILPFFLSLVVIIYQILPTFQIKADTMPTDSQYRMLGSFMLSELIRTGEATELDFSDYDSTNGDLLLALGEAVFTGDFTGLVQIGLDWLDDTVISAYDTFKKGIREWEYSIAPDLYEAWYGSTPFDNALHLSDCIGMAEDLFNLIQPPSSDSGEIVSPPSDLRPLLDTLSTYKVSTSQISLQDWSAYYFDDCSIVNAVNQILDSSSRIYNLRFSTIGTISLITELDGSINATYSGFQPSNLLHVYQYGSYSHKNKSSFQWHSSYWTSTTSSVDNSAFSFQTSFEGIYTAINYIYSNFRHINLYVDGSPWVQVTSSPAPTYPIVIPDTLTIWDGQQLTYDFPDDTYIDLSQLTNIISTAINNSDVVQWSDIDDTYLDINGQQAVAVTRIYRNDDDNLYIEQYANITLPKFSHNQISILGNYVNPVTQVVEESTDVLPTELVTLFKVAVILMLFACLVHRLLE